MVFSRRSFLLGSAGLVTAGALPSTAQTFPDRPIRWLIGFAAGGGMDSVARILAKEMGENLGHPVVIENRVGGAGALAAQTLATSPPDGYTLITVDAGLFLINPILNPNVPYDPARDFAMIGMLGETPRTLCINAKIPATNLKEFVDYAKTQPPNTVNFANPGMGTLYHLTAVLFAQKAGLQVTHVPYRGAPPALTDVISGQVAALFADPASIAPHARAGTVKALGVVMPERISILPDIPTFKESGFDLVGPGSWSAVATVAKTPPDIVARLNVALREAQKSPAYLKRTSDGGNIVTPTTPEGAEAFVKDQLATMVPILKGINLKPQ